MAKVLTGVTVNNRKAGFSVGMLFAYEFTRLGFRLLTEAVSGPRVAIRSAPWGDWPDTRRDKSPGGSQPRGNVSFLSARSLPRSLPRNASLRKAQPPAWTGLDLDRGVHENDHLLQHRQDKILAGAMASGIWRSVSGDYAYGERRHGGGSPI